MAGGGIGEAMLINAAIGGGVSAVTGGDPLKGALLGGLTGGVMGGVNPAAAAGETGTTQIPMTVAREQAANIPLNNLSAFVPQTSAADVAAAASGASGAIPNLSNLTSVPDIAANTGVTQAPTSSMAPSGGGALSDVKNWWNSLSTKEKLLYGGGAGIGAVMIGERMMAPKAPSGAYEGPLKKFRFDVSGYTPSSYADGGIASLRGADITVGGGMPHANPMDGSDSGMLNWQQRSSPEVHMASGGISDLGSYSDGGRMLRGPGDGMSDNIPGVIGGKQPARLADGEFVVPADVVSHLGNGSTDAGAKQLYNMMDRVRKARTGTKKQGRQINPMRQMPA